MMMMTQNKMVSSVTDHHEMAPSKATRRRALPRATAIAQLRPDAMRAALAGCRLSRIAMRRTLKRRL